MTSIWASTAHADSGDKTCFPLYRKAAAVPGTPTCKYLAAAAPVGMGTYFCTSQPDRIERYCGVVIKPQDKCADAGNPIDSSTGNKHLTERDYIGTGAFPLVVERYYNSLSAYAPGRALGSAWRFSYDREVVRGGGGLAYISRPDGRIIYYMERAGVFDADADIKDRLLALKDDSGTITGWQWSNAADGSVELYDANGRLTRITARFGQTHTLTRSTNSTPANIAPGPNYLIRVTDHFGRQLNLTWNRNGTLSTFSDPQGNVYRYGYDDGRRLTSVTFPAPAGTQVTRNYLYNEIEHTGGADADALLTGIVDERGVRLATYDYDVKSRGISTQRSGGADRYAIAYSKDRSEITDPLGSVRTYRFTKVLGALRLAGVDQPGGAGCAAAASDVRYDANGNITSRTDFNGVTTTFTYDLARNLPTVHTEAAGTPQARTTTTVWHPIYSLPERIAEPKKLMTFIYSSNGDLQTASVQPTDDQTGAQGFAASPNGAARIWKYTYNNRGQILSVTGPRTDIADTTRYDYDDASGNLTAIIDPLGNITRLSDYDAHGRPGKLVEPGGLTVSLSYTPRGLLSSRTDAAGGVTRTTRYDYDAAGQLKQVMLPDGSVLTYDYDDAQRLRSISDSVGNTIRYELDVMGNRQGETVADASGKLVRKMTRVYDELNRVKSLSSAIVLEQRTYAFEYDANGNLTKATDPLGRSTTFDYDALSRVRTETRFAPHPRAVVQLVRYGYDGRDNLISVMAPRNLTTIYSFDGMDQKRQVVSPHTGTGTATYDAAGNLKTVTDARGKIISYDYDALSRITAIAFTKGPGITFKYDDGGPGAFGRVSTMTDESGSTNYTYTPFGDLASKTQRVKVGGKELSFETTYNYAPDGKLVSMTYPSGARLNYEYDAAARLSSVTLIPPGVAASGTNDPVGIPLLSEIGYVPLGPVRSWNWGNSTPARQIGYARTFDSDSRVTSVTLGNPMMGGIVRTIQYDEAGRIIAFRHGDKNSSLDQDFEYDYLDRLTGFRTQVTRQTYQYDESGNRTALTLDAKTFANKIDAASDRLIASTGPTPMSNRYDAAGNLISDGRVNYTYSDRNRLASAAIGNASVSYAYNGIGQRVLVTSNADTRSPGTVFVYGEQGQLIGEYDANGGGKAREIVYLGDLPVVLLTHDKGISLETKIFHIYPDHLGTPRMITRASDDAIVWRWDGGDPFGLMLPNENPSELGIFVFNMRMPGQYYDKETMLFYNYHRNYEPQTGRYIQSDPIGLDSGINTYAYAGSNPSSLMDPDGLQLRDAFRPRPVSRPPATPPGEFPAPGAEQPFWPAILRHWFEKSAPSACPPSVDKAGGKVSPIAETMPPPGLCTPSEQARMQNDVNSACKRPRTCKGGMFPVEMFIAKENSRECAIARDRINKKCFAGGDAGHRDAAIDAWNSVANCEKLLSP